MSIRTWARTGRAAAQEAWPRHCSAAPSFACMAAQSEWTPWAQAIWSIAEGGMGAPPASAPETTIASATISAAMRRRISAGRWVVADVTLKESPVAVLSMMLASLIAAANAAFLRGASPPIALSTTRRLRAMQEGRRSHGGERAVRKRSTRRPGPLQRPIDNRLPDTRPSLISRRAHFAGHDQGRGCQEQPYLSSASILSGILIAMHNKMHGTARTDLSEALHLKRSFAMQRRHPEDDERSC